MPSDPGEKKNARLTAVQILVGHESRLLEKKTPEGFTHKWTLFVRPANKDFEQFTDNKLVSKVEFKLHESFSNNLRVRKEAPFEFSEFGYASFSPEIFIFIKHQSKPIRTVYDMNLTLDKRGYNESMVKFYLKDVEKSLVEVIRRYGEKKTKRKSPLVEDDRKQRKESPERKKEKVKKHDKQRNEEKDKKQKGDQPSTSAVVSHVNKPIAPSKDVMEREKKIARRSPPITDRTTPSPPNLKVLSGKIEKLESSSRLYKIAELLLAFPGTVLDERTLDLTYDLQKIPATTIEKIVQIIDH